MTVLIIITVILLAANAWLLSRYIQYKHKVKQRGLFAKWPIKQISLDELDPIFKTNEFGPTLDSMVYFIGRGNLVVPGGTSDAEAWILATLAKKAKNIFEFGTCTGKTTYLFAKNSPDESKITTLTLSPEQLKEYEKASSDNQKSTEDAINESAFTKFLYSDTPESKKIEQLFDDSKHLDESEFEKKFDLIFIDGSHAYSYVHSDSEKAFKMVAPGGLILWHDYRGPQDTKDVYKALNEIAKTKNLVHIKDTSLVAFRNK